MQQSKKKQWNSKRNKKRTTRGGGQVPITQKGAAGLSALTDGSIGKDRNNFDTNHENQQKVAKINTSDPIEAINQAANSFKESRLTKTERAIRDGVINLMRKVGIDVSTDTGRKIRKS